MITVIAPLHSDETKVSCREISVENIGRYVDGVGTLLGEELSAAAKIEWTELKMLYVDCVLTDFDACETSEFKFHRKTGQFNINCAINCERLSGADLETQASLVFHAVLQSVEQGFSLRGRPKLLMAAQLFEKKLSPDWIRSVAQTWAFEWPENTRLPSPEWPKDSDGRVRVILDLPRKRGELWVMMRAGERHDDDLARQVVEAIQCHVLADPSARFVGHAFGEIACDVSFKVKDLREAGERLDSMLRGTFPDVQYVISNDYEVAFD